MSSYASAPQSLCSRQLSCHAFRVGCSVAPALAQSMLSVLIRMPRQAPPHPTPPANVVLMLTMLQDAVVSFAERMSHASIAHVEWMGVNQLSERLAKRKHFKTPYWLCCCCSDGRVLGEVAIGSVGELAVARIVLTSAASSSLDSAGLHMNERDETDIGVTFRSTRQASRRFMGTAQCSLCSLVLRAFR